MPASSFKEFKRTAERAPRRSEVFSEDHFSVVQLQSCCGAAGLLCVGEGCVNDFAVMNSDAGLLHEKFKLEDLGLRASAGLSGGHGVVVTADDFLAGSFLAGLIVDDAVSGHVYAHICRGFVGAFAVNLCKDLVQYGENFNVTVVVDGSFSISFQVEGVDHVHIVQISGGCLVGQVHRMLEGDVPDREGLKFRITGGDTAFVLMVELMRGRRPFFRCRSRGGDDTKGRVVSMYSFLP